MTKNLHYLIFGTPSGHRTLLGSILKKLHEKTALRAQNPNLTKLEHLTDPNEPRIN